MRIPVHVGLTLSGSAFPTEEHTTYVFEGGTTIEQLLECLYADPEKTTVRNEFDRVLPLSEELEDFQNYTVICNGKIPENTY